MRRTTPRPHGPVGQVLDLGGVERRDPVVPAAVGEVRQAPHELDVRLAGRVGLVEPRKRRAHLVEHRRVDLVGHVEHHGPLDPLRRGGGQEQRQQTSEGVPAEQDAVEPERVEEAEQVGRVLVHRVAVVRRVAQAAAAEVDREHAERGREPGGGEPVEEVGVRREAVGKDEHRPVAAVIEQVEADPVRLDEPALAHDAWSSPPQRTTLAAHV